MTTFPIKIIIIFVNNEAYENLRREIKRRK